MDHEGGDAVGKALVNHKVPAIGQHRLVEPGDIPQKVVEARAGHPPGGVQVDAVKGLHDVHMVGNGEVGDQRLAKALNLHIGRVIGADGHGGIDDLGDDQHDFVDLLSQLVFPLLQVGQTVGVGLDLGLQSLGFGELGGVLLGLSHQDAYLFGFGVTGGAEILGLLNGLAVLGVQLQHLIHQGEFLILKFLFDIFLHGLGIFPDKANIQHGTAPQILNLIYCGTCFT